MGNEVDARIQSFGHKMEMAYADLSETTNLLLLLASMDWHYISDAFTTSHYFLPFLLWLVLAAFLEGAGSSSNRVEDRTGGSLAQFTNLKNR